MLAILLPSDYAATLGVAATILIYCFTSFDRKRLSLRRVAVSFFPKNIDASVTTPPRKLHATPGRTLQITSALLERLTGADLTAYPLSYEAVLALTQRE